DLRIFMWFFPMKMKYAAMLWVAIEFLGTFDISSGIASAAHLGGLLFGIAFAWTLKKKASSISHPPSEWEVQAEEKW
ncbi:MAG TPA: rhomboid family intramembrane serine protease, partial [Candidatus Bilamarchaeaceae archaeon]|nr:rhomboid family intramembrane serine protease [Candidatus Bilamarchaeaceae archaeon]